MDKNRPDQNRAELGLPAAESILNDSKIVEIKTSGARTAPKKTRKNTGRKQTAKRELSDTEFLDTIRDDVYKKIKAGDYDLSVNDGFKAIDLKHKISSPEPDNRVAVLLEELRRELLK
jgi:hypothetical protein